jgi:glycosyltransferase involved in cell wall biosynthesis
MIKGLNNYYNGRFEKKVYIHFVGYIDESNRYKKMVEQYHLSEYIIFHGALFGEALTDIFNESDIAISSLGFHRSGIYLSSALKSREYLARGIPIVSSTRIDILPSEFKYCLYIPEDESPIDIKKIIEFYQNILTLQKKSVIISEIRQFAEKNCDISKTMLPVIKYLRCE